MGYYQHLHDVLFHLLSSPQSCWPDVAKPPANKRGRKAGGLKRSERLETMALAGILAGGYDNLKWWERQFLKLCDEHDAGMVTHPEFYETLENTIKGSWDSRKVYRVKLKMCRKVNKIRGLKP